MLLFSAMEQQKTSILQKEEEEENIPAFLRTFKKAELLRNAAIEPAKTEISPSEAFFRSFLSQSKEETDRIDGSGETDANLKRKSSVDLEEEKEEEDDDEDDDGPVAERQRPPCCICNVTLGKNNFLKELIKQFSLGKRSL